MFVSCVTCVRASGRGEAKLCGRARGDKIVVLGLLWGSFIVPRPPPAAAGVSMPVRCPRQILILKRFYKGFRGQPL